MAAVDAAAAGVRVGTGMGRPLPACRPGLRCLGHYACALAAGRCRDGHHPSGSAPGTGAEDYQAARGRRACVGVRPSACGPAASAQAAPPDAARFQLDWRRWPPRLPATADHRRLARRKGPGVVQAVARMGADGEQSTLKEARCLACGPARSASPQTKAPHPRRLARKPSIGPSPPHVMSKVIDSPSPVDYARRQWIEPAPLAGRSSGARLPGGPCPSGNPKRFASGPRQPSGTAWRPRRTAGGGICVCPSGAGSGATLNPQPFKACILQARPPEPTGRHDSINQGTQT